MSEGASAQRPAGVRFDRVEDLQAAASSIFVPLRVTAGAEAGFRAVVHDASLGPVVLTRIQTAPARVSRQARLITSTDPELVKVTLHRRGHLIVAQDDRQSRVAAGELVAYDTSRPYQLIGHDPCDVVVLGIPRSALGAHADLISRRTATALPGDRAVRSIIGTFLAGLADTIDDLPARAAPRLVDALVSLVITAFTDTPAERVDTPTDLADRIITCALANLGDPTLSVESVAHSHGVSVRYVHKLLRSRGITFAASIRRERLRRIHRDLLDPAHAHRSIAAVAARWGIPDPAHLARAFRTEFGQTPADVRRTGTVPVNGAPDRTPAR